MSFGAATAADLPALRQLWMQCFGDTEEYVNRYFLHSFVPEDVFVLREPEIAAMLISFPVTWIGPDGDEQPGAYLYAVCTHPDRRGTGCCRRLMAKAEQALRERGCAFTCLRAADAGLAEMYRRMGYESSFTNRELVVPDAPGAEAQALARQRMKPAQYYGLRQMALQGGFIDYDPAVLAHQARLGQLLSFEGGEAIGALERYGSEGILKEYLGPESLLPAIKQALGLRTLIARTPGDAPFAMSKRLTPGPLPTGYLAFAFD